MHKVYTSTLSLQGRVHHGRRRRADVWGCGRSHWDLRHMSRSITDDSCPLQGRGISHFNISLATDCLFIACCGGRAVMRKLTGLLLILGNVVRISRQQRISRLGVAQRAAQPVTEFT